MNNSNGQNAMNETKNQKKKTDPILYFVGCAVVVAVVFFFVARFGCFIIYDYYVLWLCFESSYGTVRVGYGAWLVGEAR